MGMGVWTGSCGLYRKSGPQRPNATDRWQEPRCTVTHRLSASESVSVSTSLFILLHYYQYSLCLFSPLLTFSPLSMNFHLLFSISLLSNILFSILLFSNQILSTPLFSTPLSSSPLFLYFISYCLAEIFEFRQPSRVPSPLGRLQVPNALHKCRPSQRGS